MEQNFGAREDDSAFDYLFDKFSQDINEFQKTNTPGSSNDAANHEDFTDTFFSFIESRCDCNEPSHSIINLIQQDFQEFEKTELPPCHEDPTEDATRDETQEMINELRHETQDEFNINHENNASAYGSCDFAYSTSVVRYFFCGQTEKEKANAPKKRMKRKYRGVILSEEEAARKKEQNKIKNRETAAKAHDMKLAYEARLRSMHLKLRQKNEHLKKLIMFLEFRERINVPPKPLERTFSAPL